MDARRSSDGPRWAQRILDSLTVLLFLALISAPTIDLQVRPDDARSPELVELRVPAPPPPMPDSGMAMLEFPAKYEEYFKDSFGLRDRLLRWNSLVKVFGFGVSPSSEVFFGKQGWIFYTGAHSQENHRGAYPFHPRLLERWGATLETKRAQLEELGVRYLYVIAPDKETVYSELLPDFMHAIGPTRRAQFLEYMRLNHPKVEVLDLSGALEAAKRDDGPGDFVYTPLGTHWSGRGSRVALRALLERLDQLVGGFAPGELDSFERVDFSGSGDSWTTRMYIGDLLTQTIEGYMPPVTRAKVRFEGNFRLGRIRKSEIENSTRPRVILMHDSFGPHIESGFSEQCSYLECHWDMAIDPGDLATADADVFIDMLVERSFNHLDPKALLPLPATAWQERFEKSVQPLVSLDKTQLDWGLSAVGDARIGPAQTIPRPRLPLLLQRPADRVELPALNPIEGEIPLLHLSIDSPVATQLYLYYRPPGAANFVRRYSYRKSLQPGSNEFYMPLDREGTRGALRLSPGEHLGTYLLHEFEIRSVPAP